MSMRPSITRFRDPDTGKIVGQEDESTSGVWVSKITRFGSMFASSQPTATAVADSPAPAAADTSDAESLKLEIRRLKAAGDEAGLRAIGLAEYSRPDGGRPTVRGALSFAGVKKPETGH